MKMWPNLENELQRIYPRGRLGNFQTKLKEDTYYMLYRAAGNDVEVYDYDTSDPDMKDCI
jgi:hypothetical protein